MKTMYFFIVLFFIIQPGFSGNGRDFNNIHVSGKIKLEITEEKNLKLEHPSIDKPFYIISDGVYVYFKYDGEIMGQFLGKYDYFITPKHNQIDIVVKKHNGKFLNQYTIEEYDHQIHIAQQVVR